MIRFTRVDLPTLAGRRRRGRAAAVARLVDRALDVLDVEALFRGELHELRVLGIAKRPVLVLGRAGRAVGLMWSLMKSVPRRSSW